MPASCRLPSECPRPPAPPRDTPMKLEALETGPPGCCKVFLCGEGAKPSHAAGAGMWKMRVTGKFRAQGGVSHSL